MEEYNRSFNPLSYRSCDAFAEAASGDNLWRPNVFPYSHPFQVGQPLKLFDGRSVVTEDFACKNKETIAALPNQGLGDFPWKSSTVTARWLNSKARTAAKGASLITGMMLARVPVLLVPGPRAWTVSWTLSRRLLLLALIAIVLVLQGVRATTTARVLSAGVYPTGRKPRARICRRLARLSATTYDFRPDSMHSARGLEFFFLLLTTISSPVWWLLAAYLS